MSKETRNSQLVQGLICAILGWVLLGDLGFLDLIPFLRTRQEAIWGVALVGALTGATRTRVFLQGADVALISLWLLVAFSPLGTWLIQPLRVAHEPATADAVVILGGGFQPDNDFSTATLERTVHGLELMQGGFAPHLIVSEEVPPSGAAKALKAKLKISGSLISIGAARNTHDEAILVSELARQKGWGKILLVTSPAHSRRAMLTFQKLGLKVISSPCRETSFDFENQNDPRGHVKVFATAMREYVGLRIYRARGWA